MPASPPTFCAAPLGTAELEPIGDCVAQFRRWSRAELAATVCEWLAWQRPNGRLKTRECRDLLEPLELIELPALRAGRPRAASRCPERLLGALQLSSPA